MAHDIYPLFRPSEVISTKDPDDLGRIKLRVFPELADHLEDELPWCLPLASGPHDGDFGTPLEEQWVYCVIWNKYWCEISFLPWCIPDPKNPKFNEFKNNLIPKVKDYSGTPDIQHTVGSILEDKYVEFHDTKESQHGFLHPSGTYGVINKKGKVFIHSVDNIEETVDKNMEVKITETSKHSSADTDIHSTKPIGLKGTETLLGGDVLQVLFDDWIKVLTRNPVVIPPAAWPPAVPVPPAPPIINMYINGLVQDMVAAVVKAKANCKKALK